MNHFLLALIIGGGCAGPPAEVVTGTQPAGGVADRVVDILDRLETAGRNVSTIRCAVKYTVNDKLNITVTTKYGSIIFKRSEPHPMFMIHFHKLVAEDIVRRDKEWWLFRERWLWEIKGKSKTIIKREVLRPGEQADFFDLETAPFPVPFGQRRDQILKNFEVSLVDAQVGDPAGCDHLVCWPKDRAPLAKEYRRLDFYVSCDLHLPLRIVAEDAKGNKVTVADFPDLGEKGRLNIALPDSVFVQPQETRGFQISQELLPPSDSAEDPWHTEKDRGAGGGGLP